MTGLLRYESPFDRALGAFFAPVNGSASVAGGSIDLDVVETPEAFVVKAEVPGVAKDKIEVKVEDRDVTIAVEYREELEPNGKALWRVSFNNPRPQQAEQHEVLLTSLDVRIRDVQQGPDGNLYVATERTSTGVVPDGTVLRIEPAP